MPDGDHAVPIRTILATIALVLATLLAIFLLWKLGRIVAWLLVAGFFTVLLTPPVDYLQSRTRMRRGLATTLVFLSAFLVIGGMLYVFIRPIVDQVSEFVDELPEYVEDAREGRGTIGELVQRYDIDEWVEENQDRIDDALRGAGAPALDVARRVFNTLLALITILVLTFLMTMRSPQMTGSSLALLPERHRERVRLVAGDAARAVSGYMFGNLLISLVAGVATYTFLKIAGVPYAEVLALFVAFADLIPLVGATLGAIPTIGVSFLHSTPAGIASVIFYVVYQQFENHVLQVTVMSRTVQVNPLTVLISVLCGVELFGILGALLAIPAAGIIQVVARNLYDERRGRLKDVPTVGTSEMPVTDLPGAEAT